MKIKKYLPFLFRKQVELVVIDDPIRPENIQTYYGIDLSDVLNQAFKYQPTHAKLYEGGISLATDITEASESYLDNVTGRVVCVVLPAAGIAATHFLWTSLAALATSLLVPEMPNIGEQNQPPSPTNSLADRENKVRLGGRIQDAYGGRVTPDLVAASYRVYINHKETRFSYMCATLGKCDVHEAYDDNTRVNEIPQMTVQVFEPNTNFRDDAPQYQFGNNLSDAENLFKGLEVKRYSSVNGQVLPLPDNFVETEDNITFVYPNIIRLTDGKTFTNQFSAGDTLKISSADAIVSATNAATTYDLDGEYTITSVTDKDILLTNPQAVSQDWQTMAASNDTSVASSPVLSTDSQTLWTQWFYSDLDGAEGFFINFLGRNGLYASNGNVHTPIFVDIDIEYQYLDANRNPTGLVLTESASIVTNGAKSDTAGTFISSSDDTLRRTAALTHFVTADDGQVRWRAKRKSPTYKRNGSTVMQEVVIQDFYSYKQLIQPQALNKCTTLYVKETANTASLARKKLRLEIDITRYVRDWQNNDALKPSRRIDDIFYHAATDASIGNQPASRLNMLQIKEETEEIISYFGDAVFAEFTGVFDDKNMSPQETLNIICAAGFSQPYVFNNQLHMHFEKPEAASVVQFTSSNILPNTLVLHETFGSVRDKDGVEVSYRDSNNKSQVFRYPSHSTNPRKINITGVNDLDVIKVHAMRAYQKDQLAYKDVVFTGADETSILLRGNRIGVANITRADVQSGSVRNLDVVNNKIVLTTSQPCRIEEGSTYTVFVQQNNAVVDNIPVTSALAPNQLVLSRLPRDTISYGTEVVVNATYELVKSEAENRDVYLVTEIGSSNVLQREIKAINYHPDFYKHDKDHLNA